MARRRKSTSNGKSKETKTKERTVPTDNDMQVEEKDNKSVPDSDNLALDQNNIEKSCTANTQLQSNNDDSQDKLMPLDIQQMILGDLQNAGQGEGIIVSRESSADLVEGSTEVTGETEITVTSAKEEEYEVATEEDEEEELILMNDDDDDGEESQYVIVVNSDFEDTDDTGQEVVSIHKLSDLQEGSCEIITVVRESDYESSQESVDGLEDEDCDNINAVIGTIDGIHCVNISQYNSDDETSFHEEDSTKEEIKVTEIETEVVFSGGSISLVPENKELNQCGIGETSKSPDICEMPEKSCYDPIKVENCDELGKETTDVGEEKNIVDVDYKSNICIPVNTSDDTDHLKTSAEPITNLTEPCNIVSDGNALICVSDEVKTKSTLSHTQFPQNYVVEDTKSSKAAFSSVTGFKSNEVGKGRTSEAGSKETGTGICEVLSEVTDSADSEDTDKKSDGKCTVISNENLPSVFPLDNKSRKSKEPLSKSVKSNQSSCYIQEDKVTSNYNVSVSKHEDSEKLIKESIKSQITENSNETILDSFQIQTEKGENRGDFIKEEVSLKDEEEKQQGAFRSRSGSTDTTGSESGSNSSCGRRRSGRIRSIGASKHNECSTGSKSVNVLTPIVSSTTTTPPVPGFEADKPVKVKSRWRRSSELEMGSNNRRQQEVEVINANMRLMESDDASTSEVRIGQPTTPPDSPLPDKDIDDVLSTFMHLDCNEYHTERTKSKEAKRMVCDCTLTKEEIARGDVGCGEDCLNRLLMIECGARCMLGERCANKRFQNLEYAKCEVFKTKMKGFGLKSLEDIPADTFLLEYVGEVLDPKEFRKRAKEYAKDKNRHYYFMALKSDSIIDATQKGNISRFINHSCDPNAETQKWTVNGELRVGFFSKRPIVAGEEITFDYQLQRYGKEAQRCYCQTSLCRGWIGEDPEKENKWSDLSGRGREKREKKKKEDRRNMKDMLDDIDLEEEIEKLVLKNRAQTLMLCRLMVRAEDQTSREQLLNILQKGETACLRLFLDYHGLRLIWSWMMDPATSSSLKIEILETLSKLPIQNKTMLQDSKVLSVVEKWSTSAQTVAESKDRSSTEEESDKGDSDKEKRAKENDLDKISSYDSDLGKPVETEEQQEKNKKKIIDLANTLLKEWASLKEVFRIPKKERIEQMKEHEREADKGCKDSSVEKQDKSHERSWNQDKQRSESGRKRGRESPDSDKAKKTPKVDDRQAHLTKLERRQLFAIKAAQEEEERLRRQQQETLWQEEERRQQDIWQERVQQAAHELVAQAQAQENNYGNFTNYPPPPQQWMPFGHQDPNMIPPPHMEPQIFGAMNHNQQPPPFPFNHNRPHLPPHPPFLDPNLNAPFPNPVNPIFNQPPPLPKQPLLPTPNQQPLLANPPLPTQPLLQTSNQPLLPPPSQSLLPSPNQQLISNPPLPNQPFMPSQQNQPLLPAPPLPTQPLQLNHPPYNPHPPLPSQPPPIVMTNQPPPIVMTSQPPPTTQQFTILPQQNQFNQPPPFPNQPPLPNHPPTPSVQSVYQTPTTTQFQPPVPQTTTPSVAPVSVTTTVPSVPLYLPVRLPPKWKSAKDSEGRTYYYHVKTRMSQWEPPIWEQQQQQQIIQESESETDSSDSDDDSSLDEEDQEDEKVEEEPEPAEEEDIVENDLGCEELADEDSPYEPETMELLEDIDEDPKKTRKDNLVQERIISPRTADEIPDKLDKRKIRELKEKLRRQKAKEKFKQKQKSKLKLRTSTSKCEADTSSDPGRKIKDAFRQQMASVIVHYLNAYRKADCKIGRINNNEDFKHLARKLTHFVMLKELKHCRSVDELECNDNVKHKARDFIKKYMAKFGPLYQRPSDDD